MGELAVSALQVSYRYSPIIYIVLYVILFPIGLLLLLARPTQSLTFTFEAENGATRIVASGTDNRVRRRLLSAGFAEGSGQGGPG